MSTPVTGLRDHDWSIDSNERLYRWFDHIVVVGVIAAGLAAFAFTVRVGLTLWWESVRWRMRKTLGR